MSKPPTPGVDGSETVTADVLRAALDGCARPLRSFKIDPSDVEGFARSGRPSVKVSVPRERLPVPISVALVMQLVLKAHSIGRSDKLAWEYLFTYRDRHCSIALEKFGLRLYLGVDGSASSEEPTSGAEAVGREIISKLSAATRCMEKKFLSKVAAEQAQVGRITIGNQASQLRHMYEYYRDRAEDAYAGRGPQVRKYDQQSRSHRAARMLGNAYALG